MVQPFRQSAARLSRRGKVKGQRKKVLLPFTFYLFPSASSSLTARRAFLHLFPPAVRIADIDIQARGLLGIPRLGDRTYEVIGTTGIIGSEQFECRGVIFRRVPLAFNRVHLFTLPRDHKVNFMSGSVTGAAGFHPGPCGRCRPGRSGASLVRPPRPPGIECTWGTGRPWPGRLPP